MNKNVCHVALEGLIFYNYPVSCGRRGPGPGNHLLLTMGDNSHIMNLNKWFSPLCCIHVSNNNYILTYCKNVALCLQSNILCRNVETCLFLLLCFIWLMQSNKWLASCVSLLLIKTLLTMGALISWRIRKDQNFLQKLFVLIISGFSLKLTNRKRNLSLYQKEQCRKKKLTI